jgi:hypothetical protein
MIENPSTPPQTLTDRCMCGAVSYKISAPLVAVGLCHCDRCRPQAGSAFSTVMFVQRDAFEMFVSRRMPWVSALPGAAQFDGNPTL